MFPFNHRMSVALLSLVSAGTGVDGLCVVASEEVRLYTNADLERFPALPDSTVAAAVPSSEEWDGVVSYIEREHARIDAQRTYELERDRAAAEVELIRSRANRRSYYLPVGAWGVRETWGRDWTGRWRGGSARVAAGVALDTAIRPLHAGPTRAQIDYYKATRRSGADAFPSRARRSGAGGGHGPSPHGRRPR